MSGFLSKFSFEISEVAPLFPRPTINRSFLEWGKSAYHIRYYFFFFFFPLGIYSSDVVVSKITSAFICMASFYTFWTCTFREVPENKILKDIWLILIDCSIYLLQSCHEH